MLGMIHNPDELILSAERAIELLKDGNKRYLNNNLTNKGNYAEEREILDNGQKPFAVILTCSDSRVVPEIFFDEKLGDIFVIRNAGNMTGTFALGSIEYAVSHLKSPLVVVIGHSKCGAVTSAYEGAECPGSLGQIVKRIRLACANCNSADDAIRKNIEYNVAEIKKNEVIRHLKTRVIGAYYDIHTGEVSWL